MPRTVTLRPGSGSGDGWASALPLRSDWPQEITIDARALRFVVPTFLIRLRSFLDHYIGRGHTVTVRMPLREDVRRHLCRMKVHEGLPDGVFSELEAVPDAERSDVLVPVTCLRSLIELDQLTDEYTPMFAAHLKELGSLAAPLHMGISELCGNGIEHGHNDAGCYFAAQRYPRRLVLSVGDLGPGIPRHIRRQFPQLRPDTRAIAQAAEESVTGTGTQHRGQGLTEIFREAADHGVDFASLTIRSGNAKFTKYLFPDGKVRTGFVSAYRKRGTWITFELGAPLEPRGRM